MSRILIGLMVFASVGSTKANAAADYSVIWDLLGTYPVSHWNGDPRAAGSVIVIADSQNVGIITQGLAKASVPVPDTVLMTPKETTTLTREGDVIVQTAPTEAGNVRIEYRLSEGQFEIASTVCDADAVCVATSYVATKGKVPGEQIDVKDFFKSVAALYLIEQVAGHPPKESSNTTDFDLDSDPLEAAIYAPYCLPSGVCDPGYVPFPYSQTTAFKETLAPGHEVITLLVQKPGKLLRYNWENKNGTITFRNFQYKFMNDPVICLEHVMHRM